MERKKIEQNLIFTPSILELKNERRRKKENCKKEYKQSRDINKNKKNIPIKIFHSSILKKKKERKSQARVKIYTAVVPLLKKRISRYIYIYSAKIYLTVIHSLKAESPQRLSFPELLILSE